MKQKLYNTTHPFNFVLIILFSFLFNSCKTEVKENKVKQAYQKTQKSTDKSTALTKINKNFGTTKEKIKNLLFYNNSELNSFTIDSFQYIKPKQEGQSFNINGFYHAEPYLNDIRNNNLYYRLTDDSVIIPMKYYSPNIFTIWKENKDSIYFSGSIKRAFGGTYFHSGIDSIFTRNNRKYMISIDDGGEGGDIWLNYSIGELKGFDYNLIDSLHTSFNGNYQNVEYAITYGQSDSIKITTFIKEDFKEEIDTIVNWLKINKH